jgi:hypothetical protein
MFPFCLHQLRPIDREFAGTATLAASSERRGGGESAGGRSESARHR